MPYYKDSDPYAGDIPVDENEMEDGEENALAQLTVHERSRLEAQVLWPLEQIIVYGTFLSILLESGGEGITVEQDRHPLGAISGLLTFSYDEERRQIMCQLGALHTIASLFHLDYAVHGPKPKDQCCNSLRRYALMALLNLTTGDDNNKALLCANKEFMEALVAQLDSAPDELLQVTGSVLSNLSWRADNNIKAALNELGTVTALVKAAMKSKNENTLDSILSVLWILSAHSSTNKTEFCAVEGALAFVVDMLTYEGHSKTLTIIEIAGGILCNVSSQIALREDYRKILRQRNCLGILLQQLKSESLEVVNLACGTLWVLSTCSPEDQKYLWDNGAVAILRPLTNSKYKEIAEGSEATLNNVIRYRIHMMLQSDIDLTTESPDQTPEVPPDHGDLKKDLKSQSFNLRTNFSVPPGFEADQETELPIDYSVKYNSEVVANIQPSSEPAFRRKPRRKNKLRNSTTLVNKTEPEVVEEETRLEAITGQQCSGSTIPTVVTTDTKAIAVPSTTVAINSAQETPLMFSRRSSVDSLASSINSPPELPDSPTHSVPQSQRSNSNMNPPDPGIQQHSLAQKLAAQQRLLSVFEVFEDDEDISRVEDTPAQSLCATSLTNLNLDDEPEELKIETNSAANEPVLELEAECLVKADEMHMEKSKIENCALTDGKEELEDTMLLTTCINIGMKRGASSSKLSQSNSTDGISIPKMKDVKATDYEDIVWQYFTRDAPHIKKRRKKKFSLRIDRPDNYNEKTNARLGTCA